jgi:hypothetical protein
VYRTAYFPLPHCRTTPVAALLLDNTRCRNAVLRRLHSAEKIQTVLWQGEWLDLAAAEREGRLHWGDDVAAAAQSGAQDVKAAEQLRQGQAGAAIQCSTHLPLQCLNRQQRTHWLHLVLRPLPHAGMVACRLGRWRDAV